MMNPIRLRVLFAVLLLFPSLALAQGFAREDRLEALRSELGEVSTRVQGSISETMEAMNALEGVEQGERHAAAVALLDSIEEETRAVLEKVKLNSPFMDALDDARANVVTILRKNEREPASPERDARVARLTVALSDLEDQYKQIQAAESRMTRLLSDHALLRREIQLDSEVQAVERFVERLGRLTDDLDEMANVLASIAQSPIDTGAAPVIGQE